MSAQPPSGDGPKVASLVHELRQPLFALKARLQLAVAGGAGLPDDVVRELLSHVCHLEDLLAPAVNVGRQPPADVVDLREEVQRALTMLGPMVQRTGANLEVHLPPERMDVRARGVAMRQVVLNLAGNALDAVAGAEAQRVLLQVRRDGGDVCLDVQDSGPGLSAEVAQRLFEPFVTTKAPGRGTGLGLYIARQLVVEAGGSLMVVAATGSGARFEVRLPGAGTPPRVGEATGGPPGPPAG